MKTKITLLLLATGLSLTAAAHTTPADSLLIRFGSKGRLSVYAPTKAQLKNITRYDLNRIVQDMVSKLDSVPEGQVYTVTASDGQRYRQDTLLVVKKDRGTITVKVNRREADTTSADQAQPADTYRQNKNRQSNRSNWRVSTDLHLGLNTWVGGSAGQMFGGNSYELNPLGSRYVALSLTQNPAIVRTDRVKLSVRYGLQVAWNNFMFQENVRVQRGADQVVFAPYPTALAKSKLTVCNLEIPVVPQLSFYNSDRHRAFTIGLGGYVGYRIDSYTKIKQDNGDKFHDHNSFLLNNLQYGLQANVGLANLNFFVKYSLTNSFQTGKGPEVRPLSFGITI